MIYSTASTIKNNRQKRNILQLYFHFILPLFYVPLIRTYNQTLPNFRKTLSGYQSLLKIKNRVKDAFKEQLIIAYCSNKILGDMIGGTTIENNQVECLKCQIQRMFKMSDTICRKTKNQIQYKTQQLKKRCSQKGQFISIKLF